MAGQSVGITGYGAYIPRARLARAAIAKSMAWLAPGLAAKARGTRAMGNWDEDSLTMAVEACRDLLGRGDDRSHVDSLTFASTTLPFASRLNAGIIATALTLEENLRAKDTTASQRCASTALEEALMSARTNQSSCCLVVASDHRKAQAASPQEMDFGDGAAVVSVGAKDCIAKFVAGHSITVDFADHFRGAEMPFNYSWEERWVRDEGMAKIIPKAARAVLDKASLKAEDIDHVIIPTSMARVAGMVAKKCGLDSAKLRDPLLGDVGDSGAAHGLMMLVHTLQQAKPKEKILLLQFGSGCDALLFETTDALPAYNSQRAHGGVLGALANGKEEDNYLKLLVFNDLVLWDKGMRAEQDNKTALSTLYRNRDMILGLVGGRCRETGVVQFPRTRVSVNPNSATVDTQEPYKFAERKGTILSWSADYLSFSMNPPNHYGMVVFDGGGRIMMDFTDIATGEVSSGMDMRMVFRIKSFDAARGFRRYFWKAVPLREHDKLRYS